MEVVEFDGKKIKVPSPHYVSGDSWRVQLVDGLNELNEELIERIKSFDGIDLYIKAGAIVFRKKAVTPFQRRHELEQLITSKGVKAIAEIAATYGITKPKTGWKDAISLIIDYEQWEKTQEKPSRTLEKESAGLRTKKREPNISIEVLEPEEEHEG